MKCRGKAFHRHQPRRFARPINRAVRGQPMPNKTDSPWYRKAWGSRPAYKRHRLAEVA